MKTALSILLIFSTTLAWAEQPFEKIGITSSLQNYFGADKWPADSPLAYRAKPILDLLAKSRVPKASDATRLAFAKFHPGGPMDAREGWEVTGLYLFAPIKDRKIDGDKQGLVWELRWGYSDCGVAGVVWVMCSTGEVRTLYP